MKTRKERNIKIQKTEKHPRNHLKWLRSQFQCFNKKEKNKEKINLNGSSHARWFH